MRQILLHIKFGFRSLEDALAFYEKAPGNHIAQAPYWGNGLVEEIYWVNKPEEFSGDPETGLELYNLAHSYSSFVDGSVDTPLDEFSYLPGYLVLRKRESQ